MSILWEHERHQTATDETKLDALFQFLRWRLRRNFLEEFVRKIYSENGEVSQLPPTRMAEILAAENDHRLEDTLATLHEECVFEDRTLQQTFHGRKGAGEYYTKWWNTFDLIVKGEKRHWTTEGAMIAETHYQGTHIGEFPKKILPA